MLILVGVTINVALNGGLFGKAKDATFKTKISQIQEGLLVKKAELVADNNGKEPIYNLAINDLDIANELKDEYGSKLKIGADGKLYYDSKVVTNASDQNQLEAVGINKYVEPPTGDSYTFTLADVIAMEGMTFSDGFFKIPFDNFWPDIISNELRNSGTSHPIYPDMMKIYNVTCSDLTIEDKSSQNPENAIFYRGFVLYNMGTEMWLLVKLSGNESGNSEYIDQTNWELYKDLSFTITK